MVFGNNAVSNISKLSKIPQATKREWCLENSEILRAGIIAKYYVQVMVLFVYNRSREIFGNAQETSLRLKKKQTQVSMFVTIFFTSMEEMIDSIL